MSTNDTDWNVFSNTAGTTIIPLDTLLDVKFYHDKANTGDLKIELSLDGLEYDDPNKVWTTEITGNTTTNIHLLPDSTNAIIVGFGTDQYEYQATDLPPQEIYADYCSFKINGEELAKQSIQSGFCFGQSKEFHQIVGYKDNQLISEFCHNSDGSDAVNINGDLAVVFSGFSYSNSLTYDSVRYTDEENIRYYKVNHRFTVSKTTSKTGATYNLLHYAPKNAYSFNAYFYTNGCYNYVRDVNEDNSVFYGYKDQSVSWANQTDRKVSDIKISDKTGKIWLDRRSYDDNEVGLYNKGHSLKRGVKQ